MNDKDKTNYLRQKLVSFRANPGEDESGPKEPSTNENKPEKKIPQLSKIFQLVFMYLAFYGAQYIILSKYVNPELTLNFFEAGIIYLCITSLFRKA